MLEYFVIFAKGGAILWTFGQILNIKGSPINALIQSCLLEDRGGHNSFTFKPESGPQYTLRWVFDNVRSCWPVWQTPTTLVAV